MKVGNKVVLRRKYIKWLLTNMHEGYGLNGEIVDQHKDEVILLAWHYVTKTPLIGKLKHQGINADTFFFVSLDKKFDTYVEKENIKRLK